jgi:methyl-accepting chemotaxis protein
MNDIGLGARIRILNTILCALLFIVSAVCIYGMNETRLMLRQVYDERVMTLDYIDRLQYLIQRNRVLIMDTVLQPNPENVKKRVLEFNGNISNIESIWNKYRSRILSQEERLIAERFDDARRKYEVDAQIPAIDFVIKNDFTSAHDVYVNKISPLAPAVQDGIKKLNAYQLSEAKKEYEEANGLYRKLLASAVLLSIFGFLFAFSFGRYVSRSIYIQLGGEPSHAVAVASQVAKGDLNSPSVTSAQSNSSLIGQLHIMQTGLANIVGKVRTDADRLSATSWKIAISNQDLSCRTDSQALAISECKSGLVYLRKAIFENSQITSEVGRVALEASSSAENCDTVVTKVVEAMTNISSSSRKISDIVTLIDSIAFQTNILALNASVEAARAGELGRGFAVVANEVRSLAGKSSNAAKEIRQLISTSASSVEVGTDLVNNVRERMSNVVLAIQQVNASVLRVNMACRAQNEGVANVNASLEQIDDMASQNSELVYEMRAASTELKEQSASLIEIVSVFRLKT